MSRALPRTDGVRHPATGLLHSPARAMAARLLRQRYDVRLAGTAHVPSTGPAIVAANHIGLADGPLMTVLGPRPVHALTKQEMFVGRTGELLRRAGQISIDRFHADPGAIKTCLRVLADGHLVGIFPEGARGAGELDRFHRGVAYLALVSGAPVLPLTFFGTREPGAGSNSLPPKGARIDLVYGEPVQVAAQPWPRTREQVEQVSLFIRGHMLAQLALARAATGRELPGPLPSGDAAAVDDPATGITD